MQGKSVYSLGFTLVELMVTVAIVGIVTAAGIPSFQSVMRQNQASGLTNELVSSLNLARSEAIKRGMTVTMCKSADPDADDPSCSTDVDWDAGWLIFVDKDGDGTVDGGEPPADTRLRIGHPPNSEATIVGGEDIHFVSYLPNGLSKWQGGLANGSLAICVGDFKRTITIGPTGRIRISKGTCP